MRILSLFIQGNVQSTTQVYNKMDPFTGAKTAEICLAEPLHIVQSLQGLKKGHAAWMALTLEERAQVFQKWSQLLTEHLTEWSLTSAQDHGLPQEFVAREEFTPVIELLNRTAAEMLEDNSNFVQLPSIGPVAIVTSWNFSFRLAMERVIPALAAGHAVMLNLSPKVPAAFTTLHHLLAANEAAAASVQLLSCTDEALSILLNHPGIKALSFVGSEKTFARAIQPQSWLNRKMQLSFGTKNSAVILPGFEQSQMRRLLASFLNGQGQLCWNSSRLFTLESMQDQVFQWLKEEVESLQPSKHALDATPLCPLISDDRKKSFLDLRAQVSKEGKIVVGGEEKENCITPIFTRDLPNCSELQQDDLGLPLFFVTTVKYQYEIAKWANNTTYSQISTIWGDEEKSIKVANQLDSALIQLNHWTTNIPPGTGAKMTSKGDQDFSWRGSFYSDRKVFVRK